MLDLNSELRWHLSPLLIHPWQLKPILLGVEGGGRVCLSLSYIWNGLMVYKLFPFKIHLSFKKLVARQYTWYDSIWGKMLFAYKKKKSGEITPTINDYIWEGNREYLGLCHLWIFYDKQKKVMKMNLNWRKMLKWLLQLCIRDYI